MKGLLLKDCYMLVRYCKSFFLIAVVFLGISLSGEETEFFLFYPCLMVGMLPMTLLSYDEGEKWLFYADTLPCTRAQIVSCKYLVGLITCMVVWLVTLVSHGMKNLIFPGSSDFASMSLSLLCTGLLIPSIMLPLSFKLGVAKARIAYMIVVGAFAGGMGVFAGMGLTPPAWLTSSAPILLLVTAALYAASWRLSIHLYQKREL